MQAKYTDNWMRFWREDREVTLRELAEDEENGGAGVSYVHLNRIERGHVVPSRGVKRLIADALGLEVHEVFPPEGYPTPAEVALDYFEENPPPRPPKKKRRRRRR